MTHYFCDTSALFKRYVQEPGTEEIQKILSQRHPLFISAFTELELVAAVENAKIIHRIIFPDYRRIMNAVENDIQKLFLKVEIDASVVSLGKRFIKQHRLRAPDAIQLASAVLTNQKLGDALSFVCSDQPLLDAARLERLPCVDVRR